MKKFILSLLCLAFVATAHAQYLPIKSIGGGTLNIAATSTNTTMSATNLAVIEATRALDIAIQPEFKLTGAGTSAVILKFDTSIDNSRWTVATHAISVTAAGTTVVSKATNITLGGIGYLRLSQVENPNGTAITNLAIKYVQKRTQ